MAQSPSFRSVQDSIQGLERQLLLHNEALKICEQSAFVAQREIEEYFARCVDALAARKDALLYEISQKLMAQKQSINDTCTAIEARKTVLKAGLQIYDTSKPAAETIWREIKAIPEAPVEATKLQVTLPAEFISFINHNGKVKETRFCSLEGMVTTFAGSLPGCEKGNGTMAKFKDPHGICLNPNDSCLYVCDAANNAIRKVSLQGEVSMFEHPSLSCPYGIVVNRRDNLLFVANYNNHTIVKISMQTYYWNCTVFAGSAGQAGCVDGSGSNARFNNPSGIAIDPLTGNLFVSDSTSHAIRRITPQGQVVTLAGSQKGFAEGTGAAAKFSNPRGICFDEATGSLLVCDRDYEMLRRVQLNGDVSTVCDIPAPSMVAITTKGTILVTSNSNNTLSRVTKKSQNYQVEVIAGSGETKRQDGNPINCSFNGPLGIALHEASRSCFVVEPAGHSIRRVTFTSPNILS